MDVYGLSINTAKLYWPFYDIFDILYWTCIYKSAKILKMF
jgi:hypothetical protein